MMHRSLILLLSLAWAFSACQDQGATVGPVPNVPIIISYRSGFSGDSVIVHLDQNVTLRGVGFSDSLGVPAGWVRWSPVGFHRLSLELPLSQAKADTVFTSVADHSTNIDVDFDRTHRRITYVITNVSMR